MNSITAMQVILREIVIPAALIHDVQVYAAYLEERELSEFLLFMLALFHFIWRSARVRPVQIPPRADRKERQCEAIARTEHKGIGLDRGG